MNWTKLIKDKNDGKIDDDMFIIVDSDSGYWDCRNDNLTELDILVKRNKYTKEYGNPSGKYDIPDILKAIGLNSEWM